MVILGAGASKAACALPLMRDLVTTLDLGPLLLRGGEKLPDLDDFEAAFAALSERPEGAAVVRQIEDRIERYFRGVQLPRTATIYDFLVLSLRSKDVLVTFNWDPLLYDALARNRAVPVPRAFFLHGCVRIGYCHEHHAAGPQGETCAICGVRRANVPLLYPGRKNYSAHAFIRGEWEGAKRALADAQTVTVFGYGAPASDADAVQLLQDSWFARSRREFEHMEVVDTAEGEVLERRWRRFTPTRHFRAFATFDQTSIARWPRRSCEAQLAAMSRGVPAANFPLFATTDLLSLQAEAAGIAAHEAQR